MSVALRSFTLLAASQVDTPGPVTTALAVHPLNRKARDMILAGFAGFVVSGISAVNAVVILAAIFLAVQIVLHPLWMLAGDRIARTVAGTQVEPYLMWGLVALIVLPVLVVLFGGGIDP